MASGFRLPPLARIMDENSGDALNDASRCDVNEWDALSRRATGDVCADPTSDVTRDVLCLWLFGDECKNVTWRGFKNGDWLSSKKRLLTLSSSSTSSKDVWTSRGRTKG